MARVHCLFCYCPEVTPAIEADESISSLLTSIFWKLCVVFNVNFPRKWKYWDFSREVFPFCGRCKNKIARLFRLLHDVEMIQHQLQSIGATLAGAVLDSQQQWDRPLDQVTSNKGAEKERQEPRKYTFFRRKIRQSVNPQIILKDCQNRLLQVSASPKLNKANLIQEKIDGSNERDGNLVKTVEIGGNKNVNEHLHDREFAFRDTEEPSETLIQDIHDEYGDDFGDDRPCSYFGSCGEAHLEVVDVDADGQATFSDNIVQIDNNQDPKYTTTGRIKETGTDFKKKRQSRPRILANDTIITPEHNITRVKLVRENEYSFCCIPFITSGKMVSCGKCAFKYVYGDKVKSIRFTRIRNHIQRHHTVDPLKPRVVLLDSATRMYSYAGYEFSMSEDGLIYTCSTCTNAYRRSKKSSKIYPWENVTNHIKICHLRTQAGRCDVCEKEVTNVMQHKSVTHPTPVVIICEKCGQQFNRRVNLLNHMKRFHQKRKKEYICDQCGKEFFTNSQVSAHQVMHTNERSFICKECGQTFARKTTLETHFASKHGERKFACQLCDWKFGVKFLLNRHIKQVHEGIKPPSIKKRQKTADDDEDD